jgi:hypothetical protein
VLANSQLFLATKYHNGIEPRLGLATEEQTPHLPADGFFILSVAFYVERTMKTINTAPLCRWQEKGGCE